jgi:hypothetical protein
MQMESVASGLLIIVLAMARPLPALMSGKAMFLHDGLFVTIQPATKKITPP